VQVDEHDVLGALLRIGEELDFEALSSSGVAPRLRVPARGRLVTVRPSTRQRISGELPMSVQAGDLSRT
jgi:hypothetical protein